PDEDCWLIENADGVAGGFCSVSWVDHFEGASNYWMRLRAQQFLFMDALVFKEHRRRGLHGYSIRGRQLKALERGLSEGVVLIRTDNVASRESFRALGAKYAGRLYFSKSRGRSVMVPEDAASRLRDLAGQRWAGRGAERGDRGCHRGRPAGRAGAGVGGAAGCHGPAVLRASPLRAGLVA